MKTTSTFSILFWADFVILNFKTKNDEKHKHYFYTKIAVDGEQAELSLK